MGIATLVKNKSYQKNYKFSNSNDEIHLNCKLAVKQVKVENRNT